MVDRPVKLEELRAELLRSLPSEIDLDGYFDERTQIRYIGKARLQPNGMYKSLAVVRGALCTVEVALKLNPEPSR